MKYKVTQGIVHDFPKTGKHYARLNCPCKPLVLTGIIGAWRQPEYFDEWVVVHE